MPCWRAAMNVPTQFVVFPLLFTVAWLNGSRSLETWGAEYAARTSGSGWWACGDGSGRAAACRRACEVAFAYIMGVYFLVDFAGHLFDLLPPMDPIVQLHHAVSFVAHVIAVYLPATRSTRAFAYYWAGLVALEIGSGACNVWTLRKTDPVARHAYFVTMTTSNLIGMVCMRHWFRVLAGHAPTGARVFGLVLTATLAAARESECITHLRYFG